MVSYWEVKTTHDTVWEASLYEIDGQSLTDLLAKLTDVLAKVPEAYRAVTVISLKSDYDTGPEGFEISYERPKTADELASDERGRARHFEDELLRAKRNLERAEAELKEAAPDTQSQLPAQ